MQKITSTLFALIFTLSLVLSSTAAFANEECLDYAKPLATAARLLAISVSTSADALVAINKRANENEITSFNDFVDNAEDRALQLARSLNQKQQEIMWRAEMTNDYTICKQDLTDSLNELKEETNKAKTMLVELKESIKDILDQLKGAFFG